MVRVHKLLLTLSIEHVSELRLHDEASDGLHVPQTYKFSPLSKTTNKLHNVSITRAKDAISIPISAALTNFGVFFAT